MTFITPTYPQEALQVARAWRQSHNMPVFAMVIELEDNTHRRYTCRNCADLGYVIMRMPSKGPFQNPPTTKNAVTWFDGNEVSGKGFYIIEQLLSYTCPLCRGKKAAL